VAGEIRLVVVDFSGLSIRLVVVTMDGALLMLMLLLDDDDYENLSSFLSPSMSSMSSMPPLSPDGRFASVGLAHS